MIEIPQVLLSRLLSQTLKKEEHAMPAAARWPAIRELYGSWSDKHIDGLEYERTLREEWN